MAKRGRKPKDAAKAAKPDVAKVKARRRALVEALGDEQLVQGNSGECAATMAGWAGGAAGTMRAVLNGNQNCGRKFVEKLDAKLAKLTDKTFDTACLLHPDDWPAQSDDGAAHPDGVTSVREPANADGGADPVTVAATPPAPPVPLAPPPPPAQGAVQQPGGELPSLTVELSDGVVGLVTVTNRRATCVVELSPGHLVLGVEEARISGPRGYEVEVRIRVLSL